MAEKNNSDSSRTEAGIQNTSITLEFLEQETIEGVLNCLGRYLHNKLPFSIIMILKSLPGQKMVRIHDVLGLDNSKLMKTAELLGFELKSSDFIIIEDTVEYYQKRSLIKIEGGLRSFSRGVIPPKAADLIEKFFGIREIYTIGISINDIIFGNVHIFTISEEECITASEIESVIYQASLAVGRLNYYNELKTSRNQIKNLADNIPAMVALVDTDLRFTFVSSGYTEIFGYEAEEIIGRTIKEIIGKDAFDRATPIRNRALNGERASIDNVIKNKKGEERYIRTTFAPFMENEKQTGLIILSVDTTEQVITRKELEKTAEELKILNSMKDRFYSVIAHDLKGPFFGLLGVSRIIEEEFDSLSRDELKLYSKEINTAIKNQYSLLENLLSWAKVQGGQIQFNPVKLKLKGVASNAIGTVSISAKGKNISLVNYIPEDITVCADENMIKSVFQNLLSNSIKFTRPGGTVEVCASVSEQIAEVLVRDSGVGISNQNLQKIFSFESHFSLPGTSEEKGTGLGLLICREFIRKHGGSFNAESIVGKGTVFYFTLPV